MPGSGDRSHRLTLELTYPAADSELETGRMASCPPYLAVHGDQKEGECSLKPTLSERIGKG